MEQSAKIRVTRCSGSFGSCSHQIGEGRVITPHSLSGSQPQEVEWRYLRFPLMRAVHFYACVRLDGVHQAKVS